MSARVSPVFSRVDFLHLPPHPRLRFSILQQHTLPRLRAKLYRRCGTRVLVDLRDICKLPQGSIPSTGTVVQHEDHEKANTHKIQSYCALQLQSVTTPLETGTNVTLCLAVSNLVSCLLYLCHLEPRLDCFLWYSAALQYLIILTTLNRLYSNDRSL